MSRQILRWCGLVMLCGLVAVAGFESRGADSSASLKLTLQAQSVDQSTARPLETLDTWTGKPLAFRVYLAGSPTILALPNRLAQSLVIGMLGDSLPDEAR